MQTKDRLPCDMFNMLSLRAYDASVFTRISLGAIGSVVSKRKPHVCFAPSLFRCYSKWTMGLTYQCLGQKCRFAGVAWFLFSSLPPGVVDSEDIPLNLSRELLQDSSHIRLASVRNDPILSLPLLHSFWLPVADLLFPLNSHPLMLISFTSRQSLWDSQYIIRQAVFLGLAGVWVKWWVKLVCVMYSFSHPLLMHSHSSINPKRVTSLQIHYNSPTFPPSLTPWL